MLRDGGEVAEVALPNLLPAAGVIEADDFYRHWIGEIRFLRVIESDVTVLADSDESQIDSSFGEQRGVPAAFRRRVDRITGEVARGREWNPFGQILPDPESEACRMCSRYPRIFVKVERLNYFPVDTRFHDESVDEAQLRVASADCNARTSVLGDGVAQDFSGGIRCRF